MDQVVRGVNSLERRAERGRIEHVARHDLGPRTHPGAEILRPPSHAAERPPAVGLERPADPSPDVAGGAGDQDQSFTLAHSASPSSRSRARSSGSESSTIAPSDSNESLS